MFKQKSTNADLTEIDWAQSDRASLLRKLHKGQVPSAPVVTSSGWGADVAGADRRSVAAYLARRGDFRTAWWNLFSVTYMSVVPQATIERAMYTFHRFHHALTLARLGFAHSVAQTASDVEHRGVVAAVRRSVARELER